MNIHHRTIRRTLYGQYFVAYRTNKNTISSDSLINRDIWATINRSHYQFKNFNYPNHEQKFLFSVMRT